MKTFTAIVLFSTLSGLPVLAQQTIIPRSASKAFKISSPVARVALRVVDKFTLKPVAATIMVVGSRPESPVVPRMENGVYQFKIFANDTSNISIHAKGYQMLSESVVASSFRKTKIFYLTPIETAKTDTQAVFQEQNTPMLKDDITAVLHFQQSETDILPDSGYELEILADYLVRNADTRIELYGHTDDVGDPLKNLLLSFDRVDEIKKYLVSRDITTDRIRGKGFGSDLPVAPNDCEANRRLNRRVEIRIHP
jgi:outer membrane protein OmpA-like peptidoglycan-associated protein